MTALKPKHFLILGLLFLLLVALPSAVFLSQRSQETRSRANAATTLYFVPSTSAVTPLTVNKGETVSLDVMIDPGTNIPSIVKLELLFDPSKFQASDSAFTPNITAFPNILENPLLTSNSLLIALSINNDTSKAIQGITKVGTLKLIALGSTGTAPSSISFGSKTQVFSISKTDQATENVLSTSIPAYTSIIDTTPTEIPTIIPIATPEATLTPALSATPSATVSPAASISGTVVSLSVFMHAIGNSGDNANPDNFSMSNKEPKHPAKDATVFIYNASNQLVATSSGTITYDAEKGNFIGSVNFSELQQGQYVVKVQSPTHLRRTIPGIHSLIPSQETKLPEVTLITGDINNDNTINIEDYNILIGCYSDLLPPVACDNTAKIFSDLNDDSFINQIDYNLFLRELTVQSGN